ncbi:AAA family ATPase [Saliphagus sp. GCM10025334]
MKLRNAKIRCYRRFSEPNTVRLNEVLIAVVGPNEAGKSSFLNALEELNTEESIDDADATRTREDDPQISATFVLESKDYERLSHIDGAENITECTVTKIESGPLVVQPDHQLEHDLTPRKKIGELVEEVREIDVVQNRGSGRARKKRNKKIKRVVGFADNEKKYLGRTNIEVLEELATELIDLVQDSDESSEHDETIVNAGKKLLDIAEHERDCSPYLVKEVLKKNRPQFILFRDEDRNLRYEYNLRKLEEIPAALENLVRLGGYETEEIVEAVEEDRQSDLHTYQKKINKRLEDEFSKSWIQRTVIPNIRISGDILYLQVQKQDGEGFVPIRERSDGLRWFIALVSFLNKEDATNEPVLLVDEAEQHLSYDAQASLIDVLESQQIAQKVIYTTHSAGCLPSDLGTGIRPILPSEDREHSEIKNGFWNKGEGFSPLMISMGLESFAFTVTRNSLIGEGPCECILLPSLIRDATAKEDLKYQIAPGVATVENSSLDELLHESGRTAFIVDGDGGGETSKANLTSSGADDEQVRSYLDFDESADSPLVLEDFVDLEIYIQAVNEELQEWQGVEHRIDEDTISEYGRLGVLTKWCDENDIRRVQKVCLAQRIAEIHSRGENIVSDDKKSILIELDRWATSYFGLNS